jgi:hypothetical protein
MVCDDKAARQAIDEELGKGGTGEFIARLMTFRGFSITAATVLSHKKHALAVPPGIAKKKRDFALMVRDRASELLDNGGLDLTVKDHGPGISAGLKAQAELNKQANKSDDRRTSVAIAMILSGAATGVPPAHLLVGDGNTFEGSYEELAVEE